MERTAGFVKSGRGIPFVLQDVSKFPLKWYTGHESVDRYKLIASCGDGGENPGTSAYVV
jgi:hypothetical protein